MTIQAPNLKLNYKIYYDEIKRINKEIRIDLEKIIQKYENLTSEMHKNANHNKKDNKNIDYNRYEKTYNKQKKSKQRTICIIGSDARLEKGFNSKIELIILGDKKQDFEKSIKYAKHMIFPIIEYKKQKDNTFTYMNNPKKIFPTRVLDSVYVYGNYNRFKKYKLKFYDELTQKYKKIKDVLRSRKNRYRFILINGFANFKKEKIIHFDLEKRKAYYDDNKIWGFKYGPLRAIQQTLAFEIIKYIRKTKDPKILLKLPSNTIEKLEFFNGIIYNTNEIEKITDNYQYFIKEYHIIQKKYHETKSYVELDYNQNQINEIKERINMIYNLIYKK